MNLFEDFDAETVAGQTPIAESDQFAVYALDDSSYVLVQRHDGTPWVAARLSGDAVFRVGGLLVQAMRHLYRNVAANLSPINRERGAAPDTFSYVPAESTAAP